MKRIIYAFMFIAMGLVAFQAQAQTRYLDEIFSGVTKTDSLVYSDNVSIFPVIASGGMAMPAQVPKFMTIYEPAGDTASERPAIILCHSGTFFPAIVNGGFTGNRNDSLLVEIANRFARQGYVVACIDNRLGWNLTGNIDAQRETILEAAYRGIQDLRAAIRYLRKTEAEDGDPYGLDPNKIVTGGSGTGGYLVYGACFLKRYEQTELLKFFNFNTNPPTPYLDTAFVGDPYGLQLKTLNVPQNPTYSSEFNLGFTLGGACGDISWVEAGDPPILSVHSPGDQFAPYDLANVLEPIQDLSVIDTAAGGFAVVKRANELGNNDIWKDLDWRDPYNKAAAALNASLGQTGVDGLYPLGIPSSGAFSQCITSIPGAPADSATEDIAPYDWIDSTTFVNAYTGQITGEERYCQITLNNPNDPVIARTYIDSVVGYLSPRIAFALGVVAESDVAIPASNDDELASQLSIYPNPAQDQLNIVLDGLQQIDEVTVMNTNGQIVRQLQNVRTTRLQIDREGLTSGMYLIKVRSGDLVTHQKILFE